MGYFYGIDHFIFCLGFIHRARNICIYEIKIRLFFGHAKSEIFLQNLPRFLVIYLLQLAGQDIVSIKVGNGKLFFFCI